MKIFSLAFFLLITSQIFGQEISTRVSGRVEDKTLRHPLVGANIFLISKDSLVTTSDAGGNFSFEGIAPGRYKLKASFTGYQPAQLEVFVISARTTEVNVRLEEWPSVLEEVEVLAKGASYEPGEQSVSIEKTLRVPANFFDPIRVVTSYPGVIASNDQNNALIIRGNSPAGMLWRIDGLDVVNPNHLANAGTFSDKPGAYGGGVNIISSQLLDRTDFFSGTMPARYGNALSGVVDMKLRDGSKDKNHFTAQASLIGLDASAEGPLGKKKKASFLANYRYSTVGLLSAIGAKFGDEDIRFQDLTFSIDSKLSRERRLSFFGFYGSSKNDFQHKDSVDWEVEKDQYDIVYSSKNFGTGFTFSQAIKKVNLSAGVAFSGSDQSRDQLASPQIDEGESNVIYADKFSSKKNLVSVFGRMNASINSTMLETGVYLNYSKDDLSLKTRLGVDPEQKKSGDVEGILFQPYAQWRIFFSEKFVGQTAMRYVYYSYNQTGALEPRLSLEYFVSSKSSLKFSYNLVSQVQQVGTYLNDNKSLELSKAHHLDLGYNLSTDNGLRFSSGLYYHKLFDIPVERTSSSYSIINSVEAFGANDLVSKGVGENYGLEILAEKSFYDKSYFVFGGSWYKSNYDGSDGVTRSTHFDGNYTLNATYGREWIKVKKESQRTFGISTRVLYLGGMRQSPIISDQNSTITRFDDSKAFEEKLADYFRMDLRLNWRKNKKNYTRTIAIDIQNLFNVQNEAYRYYDHVKGKVTTQYQLGLIPVLVYRIDF